CDPRRTRRSPARRRPAHGAAPAALGAIVGGYTPLHARQPEHGGSGGASPPMTLRLEPRTPPPPASRDAPLRLRFSAFRRCPPFPRGGFSWGASPPNAPPLIVWPGDRL